MNWKSDKSCAERNLKIDLQPARGLRLVSVRMQWDGEERFQVLDGDVLVIFDSSRLVPYGAIGTILALKARYGAPLPFRARPFAAARDRSSAA